MAKVYFPWQISKIAYDLENLLHRLYRKSAKGMFGDYMATGIRIETTNFGMELFGKTFSSIRELADTLTDANPESAKIAVEKMVIEGDRLVFPNHEHNTQFQLVY